MEQAAGQGVTNAQANGAVDEGKWPGGPWGVWYDRSMWWDIPTVRHSDGMNWSYADGHAEYNKWKDYHTIDLARLNPPFENVMPFIAGVSHPDNPDLKWI